LLAHEQVELLRDGWPDSAAICAIAVGADAPARSAPETSIAASGNCWRRLLVRRQRKTLNATRGATSATPAHTSAITHDAVIR